MVSITPIWHSLIHKIEDEFVGSIRREVVDGVGGLEESDKGEGRFHRLE